MEELIKMYQEKDGTLFQLVKRDYDVSDEEIVAIFTLAVQTFDREWEKVPIKDDVIKEVFKVKIVKDIVDLYVVDKNPEMVASIQKLIKNIKE